MQLQELRSCALETISFPRAGPFNASGCSPVGLLQLVAGSGEGRHTVKRDDLYVVMGTESDGAPINATGCRDADQTRLSARGT